MKFILGLFLSFTTLCVYAQEVTLKKGVVNEFELKNDSLEISYSIYLPEDYLPENLNKILFVFDEEGNGMRVNRLFKSLPTSSNFIIIANQSTLSTDLQTNLELGVEIINDVISKFKIDAGHLYLSGIGQGAQTAMALTYYINDVAGVLLVNDINLYINQTKNFEKVPVLGMIETSSANYYKMQSAFNRLQSLRSKNLLFEFKTQAGWPQPDYLETVFNTIYFQNLARLNIAPPQKLIDQSFKKDYNTVEALIKRQQYLPAYYLINTLKDKYRRKYDIGSLRKLQRDLRKMRGYKNQRRTTNTVQVSEELLFNDIAYFLQEDIATSNYDNLGYWDDRIQRFEKAVADSSKPDEQRIAKRMLGYLNNTLLAYDQALGEVGTVSQKIFVKVFRTILEPKNYKAYQEIITLSAQDNDYNTAYFYLEEMLKNGYNDYEALYTITETEALKITPTYNGIIQKYLGKSKFQ